MGSSPSVSSSSEQMLSTFTSISVTERKPVQVLSLYHSQCLHYLRSGVHKKHPFMQAEMSLHHCNYVVTALVMSRPNLPRAAIVNSQQGEEGGSFVNY
ncbi:hypothetical protein E2C01_023688 [Portunus trituberculatus]|uniref:Uncharacterized protein n=1 Tax=Portunus trituberculatus TaxID=210409 RepID=A0A5B7EAP9_PORTR|nr:hypothetical protein [Portunus trituberculatus]